MPTFEVSVLDDLGRGRTILKMTGERLVGALGSVAYQLERVADQLERAEVNSEAVEAIRDALKSIDEGSG